MEREPVRGDDAPSPDMSITLCYAAPPAIQPGIDNSLGITEESTTPIREHVVHNVIALETWQEEDLIFIRLTLGPTTGYEPGKLVPTESKPNE